ncbi:MAG: hypothetical protein JXR36_04150 [Bacteroidales bacterium]|nr:hypothetical protein [Bacteroidales bacterium]
MENKMENKMKTNVTSIILLLIIIVMITGAIWVNGIIPTIAITIASTLILILMYYMLKPTSNPDSNVFKTFRFLKGKHYPIQSLLSLLVFPSRMVSINDEIYASFKIPNETLDALKHTDCIHKITGVSFGRIHDDSIRIGWKYVSENSYDLYAYYYINGERGYERICNVINYDSDIDYATVYMSLFGGNIKLLVNGVYYENNGNLTSDLNYIPDNRFSTFLLLPYMGGSGVENTPSENCNILLNVRVIRGRWAKKYMIV